MFCLSTLCEPVPAQGLLDAYVQTARAAHEVRHPWPRYDYARLERAKGFVASNVSGVVCQARHPRSPWIPIISCSPPQHHERIPKPPDKRIVLVEEEIDTTIHKRTKPDVADPEKRKSKNRTLLRSRVRRSERRTPATPSPRASLSMGCSMRPTAFASRRAVSSSP
ncbi:hypothetical protein K466DRAFT_215348 [Polyporus arcularius HHB13444]|uniref:Uncharacterized protein n=1 Tax=Polyporus arcularius HHB13444 TaxID=1314778 RepID=A0A5C3P4X0_9APHY|nr:hypothetical protein K466DRAFT_215348 [Polyporus arcularius HHB13444]